MEVPCEEIARRAFISAPQRAVLDALPSARLIATDEVDAPADKAAGSVPPHVGGSYMQEQEPPAFGDGPSAPESQPLKSRARVTTARRTEPSAQLGDSRASPAVQAGATGVAPVPQAVPRPGDQAAREGPSGAHPRPALEPSTQAPDSLGASPAPAKEPSITPRFSSKTLLAAIGLKRQRALHAERKA